MGTMVTSKNRELTDEDLKKIAGTYHAWRTIKGKYEDTKGFCRAAKIADVEKNGFVLTPGLYVGTDYVEEDNGVFEDKIKNISEFINAQYGKLIALESKSQKNFLKLGYSSLANTKFSVAQNGILEKIAQDLFKHWFIDFEFPNENGVPYKSTGGKMISTESIEIPEGWRIEKLSHISDITIGRTPPRMEKQWFSENPNDVKWISIRDLGNSGIYVNKTAEYLTKEAVERFNISIIPKNTVILSFKLTVGRIAITTEDMLSNEAIAHIKLLKKDISPEFIYLFLKKFDFSSLGSTSSIATAVNSKSIKEIPILIPDEKTLRRFTEVVEPIFACIYENTRPN